MIKLWDICCADPELAQEIRKGTKLSSLLVDVLMARGITTADDASALLYDMAVVDTRDIGGIDDGAQIIRAAIAAGEQIGIFGDYDADGVTATALLTQTILGLGGRVCSRIPNRYTDGYGISRQAVCAMKDDGVDLIITVDNGIAAVAEIALAKELGMRVILTDHHLPGEKLPPADVIIDPHVAGTPETRCLCGAGVALFLSNRLEEVSFDESLRRYGQLAALATVADVMSLQGINRQIVAAGVNGMRTAPTPGIAALLRVAGVKAYGITAATLAFALAPRINAAGRMADGAQALALLLEMDALKADVLAQALDKINQTRQNMEVGVLSDAVRILCEKPHLLANPVLILWGTDWNEGVLGIAAARLLELFGKPTILLSVDGDTAKGSCRSGEGFNMFAALSACGMFLARFGGHRQAGGLSLMKKNIADFCEAMWTYAADTPVETGRIVISGEISPEELTMRGVAELDLLEPYGCGNPRPNFVIRDLIAVESIPLAGGKYRKLRAQRGGESLWLLDFSRDGSLSWIVAGTRFDGVISPSINSFAGRRSVSVILSDARAPGFDQTAVLRQLSVGYDLFDSSRTVRAARADIPDRAALAPLYIYVKKAGCVQYDPVALSVRIWGVARPAAMAIGLRMMVEGGLFAYHCEKGKFCVKIIKDAPQVDLQKSGVLSRIEEM